MTKKKSEPNPIEEAIGDRAKPKVKTHPLIPMEQLLKAEQIPDEPSPSEMLSLEELNRQTEEKLRDNLEGDFPTETTTVPILTGKNESGSTTKSAAIPVSKADLQPAIETSSQESPPQKIKNFLALGTPEDQDNEAQRQDIAPAEDVEFMALKKYIREDGFVLSTVAFHIVTLCSHPMVTPSTTTWKFRDRAKIPDMVLALLNQEGYLEGIWPSLKIVMGSNIGNSAWTAGISTTIAFFDTIRMLPVLEELKNDS